MEVQIILATNEFNKKKLTYLFQTDAPMAIAIIVPAPARARVERGQQTGQCRVGPGEAARLARL